MSLGLSFKDCKSNILLTSKYDLECECFSNDARLIQKKTPDLFHMLFKVAADFLTKFYTQDFLTCLTSYVSCFEKALGLLQHPLQSNYTKQVLWTCSKRSRDLSNKITGLVQQDHGTCSTRPPNMSFKTSGLVLQDRLICPTKPPDLFYTI